MLVAPANGEFWLILPGSLGLLLADNDIFKNVAGMVQHNVEDDLDAQPVGFIDPAAQFALSQLGLGAEARLHSQEILDAVSVRRVVIELTVLPHGRQPQRSDAEVLQIAKLLPDPVEGPALKFTELDVKWCVLRRHLRIVETIDHEKGDARVPPILRRRKYCAARCLYSVKNRLNFALEYCCCHAVVRCPYMHLSSYATLSLSYPRPCTALAKTSTMVKAQIRRSPSWRRTKNERI